DVLELKPQILWHETERGVLGGPNLVPRKVLARMALLVQKLWRQREIKEHFPAAIAFFGVGVSDVVFCL
ncbi:hypothetical protein CH063_14790, partial [Colletotrichum higginsianum]